MTAPHKAWGFPSLSGKWTTLAFLCVIFVTYTIDRALLGLLAVPIQEETGISNVRFGILTSAIFWTYALVVPFAGLVGDRFDRRRIVGFAAVAWSVMTFLSGFAGGFWSLLLLASFAIVVPQTLYSPAANALIASQHQETRTRAMSCHQAAFYVGWFLSGLSVAAVLSLFGSWRFAFFVFGLVGLVFGLVFLLLSHVSRPACAAQPAKPALADSLRAYFGCPSAILASVGYVVEVFVMCGYCAWGPKFVAQKFGMSPSAAGSGVMLWHYLASFVAILFAGILTDRMVGRFPRFRLVLSMTAMAAAVPALLLFARAGSVALVWLGAAALGASMGVIGANQFTNLFDVVSPDFRSGAIGFLNVIAGLVGSLAPLLLGWLSQTRGTVGFETGFVIFAVVQVVAITAFALSFAFTFERDRIFHRQVKGGNVPGR